MTKLDNLPKSYSKIGQISENSDKTAGFFFKIGEIFRK